MRELEIEVTGRDNNLIGATLLVPESVDEMISIMGRRFVIDTMTRVYIQREKRRLASGWKPREKILKIKLAALSPEQLGTLIAAGFISDENP